MSQNPNEIIVSRAPGRITFCGGGSDVSPIPEKFGGACLNATINKYATTKFRWREDERVELYELKTQKKLKLTLADLKNVDFSSQRPFDIPLAVAWLFRDQLKHGFNLWIASDIGLHSGLGTSATIFTSVIGAFNEALALRFTSKEIAETAFFLEDQVLNHPGGRQDQYAAALGGFNLLEFNGDNRVEISQLTLSHDTLHELRDNLLLFFISPRTVVSGGEIIRDQVKHFALADASHPVIKAKRLAYAAADILRSGDLTGFADLLHNNWEEKKKFSTLVSNKKIDYFYQTIRQAGALAGKILGAGGGGHMLVFCAPLNKQKVIKTAAALGVASVDFDIVPDGLTTWRSAWHEQKKTPTLGVAGSHDLI